MYSVQSWVGSSCFAVLRHYMEFGLPKATPTQGRLSEPLAEVGLAKQSFGRSISGGHGQCQITRI